MKKPAKKSAKKPSTKRQQIIVLADGAGNYYELSRANLERSKVSEARKKKVAAALEDVATEFTYIPYTAIPGSVAAPKFEGGRQLHYAGFYLSSTKAKR
jgi:hypothetical protein